MIPAENIYQNRFHFLVAIRILNARSPALPSRRRNVEKVSRFATVEFDDIHGSHGQAGAIDEARYVAVETNVI